ALARFRAADESGLEVARALTVLGQVLAAQGRDEAIAVQEEALALRQRALPSGDARIAESQRELATALLRKVRDVDVARAKEPLTAALETGRAALGDDSVEVAQTRLELARVSGWGDAAETEPLLARALAGFEHHAAQEPRDPRLIECLTGYAGFLQSQGRLEEAERMLERAEHRTRELYGDAVTSDILRRRAEIAFAQKEFASAAELTRRALTFELHRWAAQRPEDAAEIARVAAAFEAQGGEPPY